ncbi:WG repeat-containing protein [Calothrix sp. NIES-2098]|uniref:WG repeat-containing protein n=1 Tax=Calothrix sp. NIES-2098 TaxID=1954171 RepID=UPI000B5EF03B|nr:hypothetical protein NIES2098_36820 [Calothrix sp. NIES-2098]
MWDIVLDGFSDLSKILKIDFNEAVLNYRKIKYIVDMKFYLQLFFIWLLFLNGIFSCTQAKNITSKQACKSRKEQTFWQHLKPSLFLIIENNKWGFIDRNGEIVIKPQFNYAQDFVEERAAFKGSNGKWGLIDPKGKVIIQPKFDKIDYFYEQRAAVNIGNKWGFVDTNGNFIIEPQFEKVDRFFEGRAAVRSNGKWHFIDLSGKLIAQTELYAVNNFSEGLAAVSVRIKDKYRRGFIDRNGQFVIDIKEVYLNFEGTWFINGLAPVYIDDSLSWIGEIFFEERPKKKWGFINKIGQLVIPTKYDSVTHFSECLATVWINNQAGIINTFGQIILEPKYDNIYVFSNGIARVEVNKKYGFIDKNGRILIEPQFYDATEFSEGLASIKMEKSGKWGYINTSGKMIIKPQFDDFSFFTNGLAKVKLDNHFAYINPTGKIVWTSAH